MVLLLATAVSQLKMDPCDLATKWYVDMCYIYSNSVNVILYSDCLST